jgi:type VI secretion system protein ImpK
MNRGTTDDGYLTWRRDPLQAHFFGTLNAGENCGKGSEPAERNCP